MTTPEFRIVPFDSTKQWWQVIYRPSEEEDFSINEICLFDPASVPDPKQLRQLEDVIEADPGGIWEAFDTDHSVYNGFIGDWCCSYAGNEPVCISKIITTSFE